VIERMLGLEWTSPVSRAREYVSLVKELLSSGEVDFTGDHSGFAPRSGSLSRAPCL
jgi:alkanesulfonate monooxygenase SsuD/methylene tetrahydromethanopterin reductase-like flavin-dependent oxidoreductase (luciferase family)